MRIALGIGAVFLIMNVATFVAYGTLAAVMGLEPPDEGSPGLFFVSVLVVKLGLAGGFVGLYAHVRETWDDRWMQYALMWWAMFAVIEIGQAIAPNYSWADALGGIIAEAIYFPLGAVAARRILRGARTAAAPAFGVLLLATCPMAGLLAQALETPVAFVNVNVVPMDTERVLERHTVIIRDGRIEAIGPSADLEPPADALRIDGTGRYVMPGLADMHVHAWSEEVLRVFVAHGVTTIRNMWGSPLHLDWRARISRGELLGPEIFTTGPLIDGSPPIWPGSTVVESADDAARVVKEHKDAGYDFIKVYNRLKPDVYDALIAAARREEIRVVGHVPTAVGLPGVLDARQSSIEHLSGFLYPTATASSPFDSTNFVRLPAARRNNINFEIGRALIDGSTSFADLYDDAKLAAIAAASRDAGTWQVPTLVVFRYLTVEEASRRLSAPEMRYVDTETRAFWDSAKDRYAGRTTDEVHSLEIFNEAKRRRVKTLYDEGARILLGSDTPNPFVVPGLSIHEELLNLVQAGLTPYQAISAGTRDAAEFLGALDSLGTVAVGRVADLVLVDANPLTDVTNVARRSGVMVRGRWIPASELREMLDEVAAAYGGN